MRTAHLQAISSLQLPENAFIYQVLPIRSNIAAISSDDSIRILDPANLRQVPDGVFRKAHEGITSLALIPKAPDTLVSSGRDASIHIWDIRANGRAGSLIDGENHAPYISLACGEQLVAAGTELTNHQANVSIWDTRSPGKVLRRYVESHNDDVTELAFHPSKTSFVLSGATDSLLNIFDTSQSEEEDALISITNHGSSIHHADFFSSIHFYGVSHDECLSIYRIEESVDGFEVSGARSFGDVRSKLGCEYVVDVIKHPERPVLVAGSHSSQTITLVPLRNPEGKQWDFDQDNVITLPGAHGEEIVRSLCIDESEALFTAGEDGQIKSWRVQANTGDTSQSVIERGKPSKKATAESRYKPY